MIRTALILAAGLLLLPGLLLFPEPARGQWIKAVELGGPARYGVYDGDVGLENTAGFGGRLGIFLGTSLSLEADWIHQTPRPTEGLGTSPEGGRAVRPRVAHDLFSVRVLHEWSVGSRAGILAGLGFTHDRYFREREVGVSGGGPGALLGVRLELTETLSLRVEGTGYRVGSDPDRPIPRPSASNVGLQAGLSYTFRGREVERIIELPPPPPDTVIVVKPPGLD